MSWSFKDNMPVRSHSHAYARENAGIYPWIIGKGLKGRKSKNTVLIMPTKAL